MRPVKQLCLSQCLHHIKERNNGENQILLQVSLDQEKGANTVIIFMMIMYNFMVKVRGGLAWGPSSDHHLGSANLQHKKI